jgi:hypothetical protein
MEKFLIQEQPERHFEEEKFIPPTPYSDSLQYFTALMRGFSQMYGFLLRNYGYPGSLFAPDIQVNKFLKSPIALQEPSKNNHRDGKFSTAKTEDVLPSLQQIAASYLSNNAPSVLRTLLDFLCLSYSSNAELKKHIRNIHAKYRFSFRGLNSAVSLEIKNGRMRVFHGNIDQPHVILEFRNPEAFRNLIFSDKADILEVILKQDVVVDGNFVYLFKLLYLVKHFQIKLMGPE